MQRDIDLIKEILIKLEKSDSPTVKIDFLIPDRTEKEISYHIKLLYQAGLIEAENISGTNKFKWIPISLTWQGHEFLDAARNDTVWKKLTGKLKEHGGHVPFHVIKELVVQYSRDLFL